MTLRIKIDRQTIIRLLDGYPIQAPTEVGLLELEATQEPWVPMEEIPVPKHMVERHREFGLPLDFTLWTNGTYEAHVQPSSDGSMTHLSIKRLDRAPTHNWRHLQQIKNEILGEDWEAVELFPAEDRLADMANQTHLWAVPQRIPLGFGEGFVCTDEQTADYNADESHRGKQEPRQPGLTVGDKLRGQGKHPTMEDT